MNEDRTDERGHSEAYFGPQRDFWWNADFLEMTARRLGLGRRQRVLEVGSGAGHWTRRYAPFLPTGARIECVDRDQKWSRAEQPWLTDLRRAGLGVRVQAGDATALPFADATFDFVTCQTLLLHVKEPQRAVTEMVRVLRPGGLLLCIEPDNFAVHAASETSLSRSGTLDEEVDAFRFKAAQARGRIARGLGNLSVGGRLPGMFTAAALGEIEVRLSDRTAALYPPYATPAQATLLGELRQWFQSAPEFDRDEVRANYLAGGGAERDFDRLWAQDVAARSRFLADVDAGRYDEAGGVLLYLVSGIKPTETARRDMPLAPGT